jgi:hypothetical protein
MTFQDIARRNYIGRTFELTQANVRQLQDDVDWLVKNWPNGGYVADKTERDTQQDRFAEVAHDLRHAWYMGNQDFRALDHDSIVALEAAIVAALRAEASAREDLERRGISDGIKTIVGEAAGAVSLCWIPKPTGVFDSSAAVAFLDEAFVKIGGVLKNAESQRQMPSEAEIDAFTKALVKKAGVEGDREYDGIMRSGLIMGALKAVDFIRTRLEPDGEGEV